MTTTIFTTRLFGGRELGVTYDSGAGTIAILGVSIAISSLSSALQAQWATAVATVTQPANIGVSRAAFGGDNIAVAVGNILDSQPTWRNNVLAALALYVGEQTLGGQVAGVETFNR